jgi:hypothetical protein
MQENPAVDGPDYVALVIEWDDDEDVTFVAHSDRFADNGPDAPADLVPHRARTIATVVGALGVLALVGWGWHRVTAA